MNTASEIREQLHAAQRELNDLRSEMDSVAFDLGCIPEPQAINFARRLEAVNYRIWEIKGQLRLAAAD